MRTSRPIVNQSARLRACRSAFAHVVVMMNAGLATTPAEEVPAGGFHDDAPAAIEQPRQQQRQAPVAEAEREPRISDEQRQVLMDLAVSVGVSSPDRPNVDRLAVRLRQLFVPSSAESFASSSDSPKLSRSAVVVALESRMAKRSSASNPVALIQ